MKTFFSRVGRRQKTKFQQRTSQRFSTGGRDRVRQLGLEPLEPRRMLASCVPTGPVLAALHDCRNWITYSPSAPYSPDNLAALTEAHITEDLTTLFESGFRGLVTYTLDGAFQEVPRIAKEIGFTHVIAGAFWFDDAQLAREKTAALAELPYIDAFIVGNEGLEGGVCQEVPNGRQCYSRQQLDEQIRWFQTNTLKPVSTTETGGQAINDPTLLELGDFATVNIQPWFNPALDPSDPVAMATAVINEYAALERLRPNRSIVIKETWFSTVGNVAATEANQKLFFETLVKDAAVTFIWGEAFDQTWKVEPSPFGTLGTGWGLFTSTKIPKAVINQLVDGYTGSYNRVDDLLQTSMAVLRRMNHPSVTGGLPINEATATDLDTLGQGIVPAGQTHWVPGQVAFGLLAQIGSHAYRKLQTGFAAGLSDTELHDGVDATVSKLEAIFNDPARIYTDSATQGKALYQRYSTLTAERLTRDSFENAIPLIDNAELFAALAATRHYFLELDENRLDGSISATQFLALAQRVEGLLAQMDFRMWFDGENLRIGGQTPLGTAPQPATGSIFDRITSETRLAAVAARANGDLSLAEFNAAVTAAINNSKIGSSPNGTLIERVPFDGTALELVGATPLLASELGTIYGQGTLLASVDAHRNVVQTIGGGLPAFGATGIADGTGGFRRFALSPSENADNPDRDTASLVTMAAGMVAGAAGKPPIAGLQPYGNRAVENLEQALDTAIDTGRFHPTYGLPNGIDLGAGLISNTPIWGFLEVAEFTTALLQYKLGGDFYERLLRKENSWRDAVSTYKALLNVREMEAVAIDAPGVSTCRENASGGVLPATLLAGSPRDCAKTWHVEVLGDSLNYMLPIADAGTFSLIVTYSNDDTGIGDSIDILVDGNVRANFHADDTNGWTNFTRTAAIDLGLLTPGLHMLTFRLAASDGFGIDFDKFELSGENLNTPPTISPITDIEIDEDTDSGIIHFTVDDAETSASALPVSLQTNNSALIPQADIVLSGVGPNRSITVKPIENQNGTATISLSVTDEAGETTVESFVVTVRSVNDTPTLVQPIPDQNATEDEPFSFTVPANTFADVDIGDGLTLSAQQSNGTPLPPWLTFSNLTRQFSGTALNSEVGTLEVTLTATDGFGGTASDTFQVNVSNVNDPPTSIQISQTSIRERISGATVGDLSAIDEDFGQFHIFEVSDQRFEVTGTTLKLKADVFLERSQSSVVNVEILVKDNGTPVKELRQLLEFAVTANPFPWQHPVNRFNVNDSSQNSVEPNDVLRIINLLNDASVLLDSFGRLPVFRPAQSVFGYFDVDANGFCTPIDALQVINFLNGPTGGEGERPLVGESVDLWSKRSTDLAVNWNSRSECEPAIYPIVIYPWNVQVSAISQPIALISEMESNRSTLESLLDEFAEDVAAADDFTSASILELQQ